MRFKIFRLSGSVLNGTLLFYISENIQTNFRIHHSAFLHVTKCFVLNSLSFYNLLILSQICINFATRPNNKERNVYQNFLRNLH